MASEELKRGIPNPKVIGSREFTEEEKKQYDKDLEAIMKQYGVLKENEHLKHSSK